MIERNKIYCMDCLEGMKQIEDNSIDLLITDPPYSTPIITAFGRKKVKNYGDLSIQKHFIQLIVNEFRRISKQDGRGYIFCDDNYYPIIHQTLYECPSIQLLIWDKGRIGMGRPYRKQHELIAHFRKKGKGVLNTTQTKKSYSTILKYPVIPSNKRLHGAEKPIKLISDIIFADSKEEDLVLDPFMGSGTTAVACKQLNRNFIGFEINQKYVDIANKRLAQETLKND